MVEVEAKMDANESDSMKSVRTDEADLLEAARAALGKIEAVANAALAQSEAVPFTRAIGVRRMLLLLEDLQEIAERALGDIDAAI
jgi:hypothetical protein